ncbi:hypothetical protein DFH28DRAFT_1050456 [Melampsora americana]|nr:hypothetical protein DFH28DRAFT_1050456 [Melampsora americana]
MSFERIPEEVLEKIINLVYYQSQLDTIEYNFINQNRKERIVHTPTDSRPYAVYLDHKDPPILTTFQNLAVLNRRFHRICVPKLWEKIRFPSDQPAPISHWTENILLNNGNSVKSASFELNENLLNGNNEVLDTHSVESESTLYENTVPCLIMGATWIQKDSRYGIGLVNIEKVIKACPALESITVNVPSHNDDILRFIPIANRLKDLLVPLPRLQHFKLESTGRESLVANFLNSILEALPSLVSLELSRVFFNLTSTIESCPGSILSRHQNLRKLTLEDITFDDQTWTFNSWVKRLTTLEIKRCRQLSPRMLYNLLSGTAPSLTKLSVQLNESYSPSDLTEQFDLPSLKELILLDHFENDLLNNFEACKNLEVLEYCRSLGDDLWIPMKRHFSQSTWPKLFILRLIQPGWYTREIIIQSEKEVEEIWKKFNIYVLIDKLLT